jgi:hypothetical protein
MITEPVKELSCKKIVNPQLSSPAFSSRRSTLESQLPDDESPEETICFG